MDSALSVTTMQMPMALFKPLNRHVATATQCVVVPLRRPRQSLLNCWHSSTSVLPLRCVSGSAASSGGDTLDVIVLDVGGMMCEGCAANVKRILESRPQVSSASVNLKSETAIVSPVSEEKAETNWQKKLGEALAEHLTSCGFNSSLQVTGQEDSD